MDEDRGMNEMDAPGGCTSTTSEINNNGAIVINESGLYALIFGSRLESARRFKHWVTSEVLPAIRKHGGYMAGQENMSDDELLAKALMVAQSKIEENKKQIYRKPVKTVYFHIYSRGVSFASVLLSTP